MDDQDEEEHVDNDTVMRSNYFYVVVVDEDHVGFAHWQ